VVNARQRPAIEACDLVRRGRLSISSSLTCGLAQHAVKLRERGKVSGRLPAGSWGIARAMNVSVVMAAYNEAATIETIVALVQAIELEKEIIIVDDGSTDGTREILQSLAKLHPNVRVKFQDHNQGKGAALRAGFEAATGDVIIIQDADLEYDPNDYYALLKPIYDGRADVVYGSRFLGGPHRVLFFWHYLGNKFLTLLCNAMSNLNLTDMETCYKVFRREALNGMTLRSNRFGFEPEFTIKIAKKNLRIFETPISYYGRSYAEGKKINWRDGVAAIYAIVRYRLAD
jgi:glycosyltransferase involved in cell wall biosynthesis